MSSIKEQFAKSKEQFVKAKKLGEDPNVPARAALRTVVDDAKNEYAAAEEYARCRRERKEAVAKRLGEIRKRRELKQQEVADKTGINVVTLSGYEIGKNEPNMEALVRLADAYEVTLDYLMCRTDNE